MLTHPNPDEILEGVQIALQRDVLPECATAKGQLTVVIAQAMLQMARELIPVQQQQMAEEFNSFKQTLLDMASLLGDAMGPEAQRIRGRADEFASRPDLPALPDFATLRDSHDAVKTALEGNVRDLDTLIRAGSRTATDALERFRAAAGPTIARDFNTMVVGAGMAGRG